MSATHRTRRLAFTLVEMLVVLGIIGVLIAILLPVVGSALITTRNARMAIEIAQLRDAVEAYKNAHGDYPPSFGEDYSTAALQKSSVVERHLQRCYPKMTQANKNALYAQAANVDQGEALVLWLSKVTNDVTHPFNPSAAPANPYDFKPNQLVDDDGDGYFSYRGAYSKDSSYIYIDSRTYSAHAYKMMNDRPARAENSGGPELRVRPYYSATGSVFINPTSYQILCAGQDGVFSETTISNSAKRFPAGNNYEEADRDNITSFSEGKTLGNSIPQ